MPFFNFSKPQTYLPLAEHDADFKTDEEDRLAIVGENRNGRVISRSKGMFLPGLIAITCLALGFIGGERIQDNAYLTKLRGEQFSQCRHPTYRREWRSLDHSEKAEYIRAVKCLAATPAIARTTGDLYNDFPYIHFTNAAKVHYTAFFLPWHRYFLHVFETKLKSVCNYNGTLAYWDWSLDWESLASSPVFDGETGFGGDGDQLHPAPIGDGSCVTSGSFADFRLSRYSNTTQQHCLSRSFFGDGIGGWLSGAGLQPKVVEEVLSQPSYQEFHDRLEHGPHKEIPNGVGGDFKTFTAPNDPLFWLHHSQLDRLWWLWQRADPFDRLTDYGGVAEPGSDRQALLKDALPSMGALAPDMRTIDVMSTESDLLCYRYH